jgi:hypothetical protein
VTKRNALLFIACGIMVVLLLNMASRALGPPRDELRYEAELTDLKGADLWVIGASTANGILPETLSADGGAFRSASDIFEAEAVVAHMLDAGHRPAAAIIVVGPGITRTDSGSRAGFRSDHRKEIYRVLYADGYRGLIGGDWRNLVSGLLVPALGDQAWREHVLQAKAALTGRSQPVALVPDTRRVMSEESLRSLARRNASIRTSEYDRIAYYDACLPVHVEFAMLRITDTLHRQGAKAIFVVPPFHKTAIEDLRKHNPDLLAELHTVLGRVRKTGATVVNQLDSVVISGQPQLFSDPEHLDRLGAVKFSALLAETASSRAR